MPEISTPSVPEVDVGGLSDALSAINPVVAGGVVLAVAAVAGVSALVKGGSSSGAKGVPAASALQALAEEGVVLLDIRTQAEVKEIGSPDLKAVRKSAVTAQFSKVARDGTTTLDATFGDKIRRKIRSQDSPVIVLDQDGSEARQAGAEVLAAGFTKVFFVQGGARAWQSAGLPWKEPGSGLSLQLPSLPSLDNLSLDNLAEEFKEAPTLGKAAAALGAIVAGGALVATQAESLLEVVGLIAAGQFLVTRLLYADKREETLKTVTKLVKDDIAPLEIGEDLKQVAKVLLKDEAEESGAVAPAAPKPVPAASPSAPAADGERTGFLCIGAGSAIDSHPPAQALRRPASGSRTGVGRTVTTEHLTHLTFAFPSEPLLLSLLLSAYCTPELSLSHATDRM